VAHPQYYMAQAEAVIQAVSRGQRVHVVGYSFGAVIAALLASRHRELVNSLTLVAGWVKTDSHQLLRNDCWQKLYESEHAAMAEFTVFTAFSQSFINSRSPNELAALIAGAHSGPDRSKKMNFNRTVDIGDEVTQIEVPTLIIGCTHDQMVPIRHSKMLFGAIQNSRFLEIPAGHGVVHERPSQVFSAINDFVKDPGKLPQGTIISTERA
jgi:pimeloyl-ACP methyl ester carboxylesterase